MRQIESLSHTRWECKYHIVFIPKYRKKAIFARIRKELGEVFHRLARQKESQIEEGHLMPDHEHMMISIPPKYAVSEVVGFIKGKVRFISHAPTVVGDVILWVKVFGRGVILRQRLAGTKKSSGITFATRKRKIAV